MRPAQPAAVVLLAALAVACGGAKPKPMPAAHVIQPILTLKGAALVAADFEAATVNVTFDLENQNAWAVKVVRVAFAVEVEGAPGFQDKSPASTLVASRATATVTVPVKLDYGAIPRIAARLVEGRPLAYRATGAVGVETPAGVLDLPIAWDGTLPLPRPPTFAFEGFDADAGSAASLSFDVLLRIANPNDFALPAGRLVHRIAVSGSGAASGEVKTPAVPAGGEVPFAVPAKVSLVGAGTGAVKAVVEAVKGDEVPLRVEGRVSIGGISMPVVLEARVSRKKAR